MTFVPPISSLRLLIPLLADPPDLTVLSDAGAWKVIKEQAGSHGVAPLIAFIARPHLPPAERAWCDRILTESWVRYNRSLQQLAYLLAILDTERIQTIVLKGPLLARRYYQPPFLRKVSGDLDIAVKKNDLTRACEALIRSGYILQSSIEEALATSHHVVLLHVSRPRIELHFRLSHRVFGVPVEDFFDRAVPCPLSSGQTVWVPGPADEILFLSLHVVSGRFSPFFHLYELRRIIATSPMEVREEAVRAAIRNHFAGALAMIDVAFRLWWRQPFLPAGTELPRTWLHWRLTPRLYDASERCAAPGRELTLRKRLMGRWLDFQMTDRPSDAIRLAVFLIRFAWFQLKRQGWRTANRTWFAAAERKSSDTEYPPCSGGRVVRK